MLLVFSFKSPLSISKGKRPDILRATVMREDFFIGKGSGKPMKADTVIDAEIPRQFSSKEEYEVIQDTAIVVEAVSTTAGISNIVVTLALTASLKSMWNLQNVF